MPVWQVCAELLEPHCGVASAQFEGVGGVQPSAEPLSGVVPTLSERILGLSVV